MCATHYAQNRRGAELTPIRPRTPYGGHAPRQPTVKARDEAGHKLCARCREWHPETDFQSRQGTPDGLSRYCRECLKWYKIKSTYGITRGEYEAMLSDQGGTCAICPRTDNLVVDHDHNCCPGKRSCGDCVRGLLCGQCNSAIGLLGESAATASRAAIYLT